jgi:hypothetical protein
VRRCSSIGILEPPIATDPPSVLVLVRDADCPNLPSAISEVEQARVLRRAAIQAKAYKSGSDDIIAASPLNQKESASPSSQRPSPNNRADGTAAKTKKKLYGTAGLVILIGTEGTVQQTKIVRSVDSELDKKLPRRSLVGNLLH